MVTSDEPIRDVQMALAKEHHERTTEFGRLCNLGHVNVVEDNCATHITVEIEGEYFTDIREKFPTTQLMARLQLAIAAGRSENNGSVFTIDKMEHMIKQLAAYRDIYPQPQWGNHRQFVHDENIWTRDEAVAQGYENVSKITATVKREPMFDMAVLPQYKTETST